MVNGANGEVFRKIMKLSCHQIKLTYNINIICQCYILYINIINIIK